MSSCSCIITTNIGGIYVLGFYVLDQGSATYTIRRAFLHLVQVYKSYSKPQMLYDI